jgi:hypothetical protein
MHMSDYLRPGIHGPSLRWYRLGGFTMLCLRSAWRFWVTGRPLWGPADNATFLLDATVDYRGGPVERLSRARWRRVAWRWTVAGVPILLAAGSPWITVWPLYAYLVAGAVLGSCLAYRAAHAWWTVRDVRHAYVYPAARVLARVTGTRFHRSAAVRDVVLPPGFGGPDPADAPVRVYVPDVELTTAAKARIASAVGARLGLPDPRASWTEAGVRRVFVDLLPMVLPPARVSLESIMAAVRAAPLAEPIIGVARGNEIIHLDFRNDSPHTLGSAGSGAGKSTLYKFVAMQRLAHGAYAIILDFKKWSHLRWAGRLPTGRVVVEDRVPEIHDLLVRVLDELVWRKGFDLHQEHELAALPEVDVYVEEINTLMGLLRDYWKGYAAAEKQAARAAVRRARDAEDEDALERAEEDLARAMGLPVKSPALQALEYGVNLGREFNIHFHFIGQSMSAKAAGGRDTRESFRTRLLARWDRKTWKMLADGIDFIACPSAEVGLWAHVHGSSVEIVRVPFVADEDAVSYVLDGAWPSMPLFHGDALPAWTRPALPVGVTLADALPALPACPSLDALRKAVQRAALEPVGRSGNALTFERAALEALYPAAS